MTGVRLAAIVVAAAGQTAAADPSPPATAATVADAPRPGEESGRADEVDPGDSTARVAARGALFVPKVAIDVVLSPLRGLLWANDRYKLEELYWRVFFNDARTIGLYPTATFQTGFGLNAGGRFVDRDLFGAREHLGLQATYGGHYHAGASASVHTGKRLGDRLALQLDADWERHPNEPFYGIGNGNMITLPAMPVDPRTDPLAVETRYRTQIVRAAATADLRLVDGFLVRTTGAVTDLEFSRSDTDPVDAVYDTTGLVGFDGVRHLYSEVEVRWDERRRVTSWEPRAVYAAGWLVTGFAGQVHRLDGGPDFWRYGAEAQQFLRLDRGPRVLALRFHAEAVSGSRDEVPFSELPQLGGASFLRGYNVGRFRDRVAAVGSLEYGWDLSHYMDASVFIDAGRVYPSLADVSLDQLRCGFGVALQLHSDQHFLVEGSLASSIDGGVYLSVSFNPVFDSHVRWR